MGGNSSAFSDVQRPSSRAGVAGRVERLFGSNALVICGRFDRLAALIPPPCRHRHRYIGVLAPNAPLRQAKEPYEVFELDAVTYRLQQRQPGVAPGHRRSAQRGQFGVCQRRERDGALRAQRHQLCHSGEVCACPAGTGAALKNVDKLYTSFPSKNRNHKKTCRYIISTPFALSNESPNNLRR